LVLTNLLLGLLLAEKTTDQEVTDDTLVNDDELFIRLSANTTYLLKGALSTVADSLPDTKVTFAVITDTTLARFFITGVLFPVEDFGTTIRISASSTNQQTKYLRGALVMGDSPGTLQLQFAEFTTQAGSTTMKAGSWILAESLKN